MKRKKLLQLACLAALAFGFAACSQDDSAPTGVAERAEVQIGSVSIGRSVEARVSENTANSGKSSLWDFDGTERIGVQLKGGIQGVYTLNADKTVTATQPTYWNDGTQTINAWYPIDVNNIDLSKQTEGNLAYALFATTTGAYPNPIELNFSHSLAKLRVRLTGDGEAIRQVEAKNYTSCSLNTTDGTVTGSNEGYIALSKATYITTDGTETYWEANLAPGEASGEVLCLNGLINQQIPNVTQFEAGKMYTVTLMIVTSSEVTFKGCIISDWNAGEELQGNSVPTIVDYLVEDGVYKVYTEAGLKAWANHVNAGYVDADCTLMNDINLTPSTDGSSNWQALGTYNSPYSGTFDGNGHTVDYITLNTSGSSGFIACASGTIKNLTIGENSTFNSGESGAGSLAASLQGGGRIINCHSRATVLSTGLTAGGIVAISQEGPTAVGGNLIVGCSFSGKITLGTCDRFRFVGGLIGYVMTSLAVDETNANYLTSFNAVGCYHAGSITDTNSSQNDYVGGMTGNISMSSTPQVNFVGCYSADAFSLSSNTLAGGLVGSNRSAGSELYINSCYWSGFAGEGIGQTHLTLTYDFDMGFVDGSEIDWTVATTNMNADIKEWNAANDNLCPYHYVQTNGTDQPPTLVEGLR